MANCTKCGAVFLTERGHRCPLTDERNPQDRARELAEKLAIDICTYLRADFTERNVVEVTNAITRHFAAHTASQLAGAVLAVKAKVKQWRNNGSDPDILLDARNMYAELADELEQALTPAAARLALEEREKELAA